LILLHIIWNPLLSVFVTSFIRSLNFAIWHLMTSFCQSKMMFISYRQTLNVTVVIVKIKFYTHLPTSNEKLLWMGQIKNVLSIIRTLRYSCRVFNFFINNLIINGIIITHTHDVELATLIIAVGFHWFVSMCVVRLSVC